MLVSIRDARNSKKDRQWIERVYGEYLEALSDLNTGFFRAMTAGEGPRNEEVFAGWFGSDLAHPLLISCGPDPAGFALVMRSRVVPGAIAAYQMSEFFVRQAHRRAGVGREAAQLIFDRFAGEWEIVEYERNPGAVAFWRHVVSRYSGGRFTERSRNGEVRQRFRSRALPA